MSKSHTDVLIIGAGLTGLVLAYLLQKKNLSVQILEARDRIGGRVYTKYLEGLPSIEMGSTWLGRKHLALNALLKEFDLGVFEQQLGDRAVYEPTSKSLHQIVTLPPNTDPSFRIIGGSTALIDTLKSKLGKSQIFLNQEVNLVQKDVQSTVVTTSTDTFSASYVVSTLPPNLFVKSIQVRPALPSVLIDVAKATHTWMGESIKIGLAYRTPFWRNDLWSGTIMSNVGPIPEMYDHSNYPDTRFALKGFFDGSYHVVDREERMALALEQLVKYFGAQVHDYVGYEECVWRRERYTFIDYDGDVLPHQYGGHEVYQQTFLDGALFIAGTETSTRFPGYMDGAVHSAKYVAALIEHQM